MSEQQPTGEAQKLPADFVEQMEGDDHFRKLDEMMKAGYIQSIEKTPEEIDLEKQKRYNERIAYMDKVWSQMSRAQKRKHVDPHFKSSDRIKRTLRSCGKS